MPVLKEATLQQVREHFEDAALQSFITRGFSGSTTRQIAAAAGLTAGAIYTHYPSKEALFAAVAAKYQARLRTDENPVVRVVRRTRFPFDVPELAAAIKQLIKKHRAYWLLWYVDVIEFHGRHFQSRLAPENVLALPEMKRRVKLLRARKLLRIPPEQAFLMVYMHLFNYSLVEILFGGHGHYGVADDKAVRHMTKVFLGGLLVPGADRIDAG